MRWDDSDKINHKMSPLNSDHTAQTADKFTCIPDSTKTSDRPRIRASRATAISSGYPRNLKFRGYYGFGLDAAIFGDIMVLVWPPPHAMACVSRNCDTNARIKFIYDTAIDARALMT